jgi:hypothetical protein
MEDTPTFVTVRHFLSLLRDGSPPTNRELARALDELAMAYHEAPEGTPSNDERDAPRREIEQYKARYAELGKRFPSYGYYAVGDWTEPLGKESAIADAIDDLADIEGDLERALWRFENLGADDAHWHLRLDYEIHWGRHLKELSLYVYDKIAQNDA